MEILHYFLMVNIKKKEDVSLHIASIGPAWLQFIIPSCGLRRKIGSALRLKSLFGRIVGSSGILLFFSHLPDKKLVVYPNRRTMVCAACFSDKVS